MVAAVVFIESAVFTRQVRELLTDEEYADLQWHLALHPKAGEVIQDTGGLRKVRWASGGSGKRGGVRVIYFHAVNQKQVRLLLIYRKGVKDDLSAAEKRGSSQAQRAMVGDIREQEAVQRTGREHDPDERDRSRQASALA
jgi:hypothetical protein